MPDQRSLPLAGKDGLRYDSRHICRSDLPALRHARTIAVLQSIGQAFTLLLTALVQREANVLAYIDGFWLTFWIAMIALGLVALMSRAPPGPFTPVPFRGARVVTGWFRLSRP
jgi:hypothetical protein